MTGPCTVAWVDSIGHGQPDPHRCVSDHNVQAHIHTCACGVAVDDLGRVLTLTPVPVAPVLAPVPQLVKDFLAGRLIFNYLRDDQKQALEAALHLASDSLPDVLIGGTR